ncbi:hypothetical protein B0H19DRAFT_572465 [Mycena capillaripes]|nr:hypothetical protein B0H19DRAFT_572465 [Mycena capillaripes]
MYVPLFQGLPFIPVLLFVVVDPLAGPALYYPASITHLEAARSPPRHEPNAHLWFVSTMRLDSHLLHRMLPSFGGPSTPWSGFPSHSPSQERLSLTWVSALLARGFFRPAVAHIRSPAHLVLLGLRSSDYLVSLSLERLSHTLVLALRFFRPSRAHQVTRGPGCDHRTSWFNWFSRKLMYFARVLLSC